MADPTPNPPAGSVPPKPAEAAKVQPKKETVRINLPPKPTAAPTIKIPTPAAAVASSGATLATAPAAPATAAAAPVAPTAAPRPVAAAAPAAAPTRPSTISRPAPMVIGVSALDKVLAIVAAVIGLAVVVRLFLLGNS